MASVSDKKILQKGPPPPTENLAANILKRTFGPMFEPLYLKAAIRSHGFFSKIFQDYFQNNERYLCDIFAAVNYKLLKTNSF